MSEVDGGEGVDSPGETLRMQEVIPHGVNMVAPTLRVEELKDDGNSSSATYNSEDEPLSHGDASDQDVSKAEKPFEAPDDELRDTIIKQVEFYFSDANILKDAFLLKHVRRNKQGYVSIKLITSFKKVKSMTKDYRIVAYSLRQSEHLEVNEEGTKVRRKQALPDYDETTPSRTVVGVNLPHEAPTIENIAELFANCGEIALIRILRPGKTIPNDVKKHINKHPEIGTTVCAVVEFESHESAKKACQTMTNKDDWRGGMRVVLLAMKKDKEGKNKNKKVKENKKEGSNKTDDGNEKNNDENELKKRKKRAGKRKNSRVEELKDVDSQASYSSGSEAEVLEVTASQPKTSITPAYRSPRNSLSPMPDNANWLSPNTTPRSSPGSSPKGSPRGSPTARRKTHGRSPLAAEQYQSLSPGISPRHTPTASPEMQRKHQDTEAGSSPSSPWVQRRLALKAQQERTSPLAGNSPGTSPLMGRRMADMEGVVRQPHGPDGTRGFSLGRGKPISPLVSTEDSKPGSVNV